ncbi:hypothetical protein IWW57_001249, partial [Coemansia sp. S610]
PPLPSLQATRQLPQQLRPSATVPRAAIARGQAFPTSLRYPTCLLRTAAPRARAANQPVFPISVWWRNCPSRARATTTTTRRTPMSRTLPVLLASCRGTACIWLFQWCLPLSCHTSSRFSS